MRQKISRARQMIVIGAAIRRLLRRKIGATGRGLSNSP